MPTAIAIRLPWGRYHATPWGRAVNEAAPEWPPSPWRLLRGLYNTWQYRAPQVPQDSVYRLLTALAAPPTFLLPPHTEAHTRHYMPPFDHTPRDKIFDPFIVISRDAEIIIRWDLDLPADTRQAAATLVDLLPYLGRADTLVEARLLDAGETNLDQSDRWLAPLREDDHTSEGRVRVLAAVEPLDVDSLLVDTTEVRHAGRTVPAGTRWLEYHVAPPIARPTVRPSRPSPRRPQVARFVLDGAAPPGLHLTVAVSDLLRRAAMASHGTPPSATLAGKDQDGHKLLGHQHAHYLACDLDGDRLLDHALVWAPAGLGPDEVRALTRLERLSTAQPVPGLQPLRLTLEGLGGPAQTAPELVGPSRIWQSRTPFVATRHRKRHQSDHNFLAADVERELRTRGYPGAGIEVVVGDWLGFRRRRLAERLGDDRRAVGLRLRFDEPVFGPLLLGGLSHFGLGIFLPVS